jgi:GNAT superfamily N-acetyltransferase
MFEIKLATQRHEQETLYRFRYQIYVEEMHRVQHDADHARKWITDRLDDDAYNFIAFNGGGVVGALRSNFLRHGPIPYYPSFYRIAEQEGATVDNASIVTRMMIAKEMRRHTLAVRLCLAVYQHSLERGVRYNFIDCNDHLVEFFTSFGFKEYMGTAVHKEYGEVHPLKLDLHDEEAFRRLNSPFLKPFLAWRNSDAEDSQSCPGGNRVKVMHGFSIGNRTGPEICSGATSCCEGGD